jgi:hypothetical protein
MALRGRLRKLIGKKEEVDTSFTSPKGGADTIPKGDIKETIRQAEESGTTDFTLSKPTKTTTRTGGGGGSGGIPTASIQETIRQAEATGTKDFALPPPPSTRKDIASQIPRTFEERQEQERELRDRLRPEEFEDISFASIPELEPGEAIITPLRQPTERFIPTAGQQLAGFFGGGLAGILSGEAKESFEVPVEEETAFIEVDTGTPSVESRADGVVTFGDIQRDIEIRRLAELESAKKEVIERASEDAQKRIDATTESLQSQVDSGTLDVETAQQFLNQEVERVQSQEFTEAQQEFSTEAEDIFERRPDVPGIRGTTISQFGRGVTSVVDIGLASTPITAVVTAGARAGQSPGEFVSVSREGRVQRGPLTESSLFVIGAGLSGVGKFGRLAREVELAPVEEAIRVARLSQIGVKTPLKEDVTAELLRGVGRAEEGIAVVETLGLSQVAPSGVAGARGVDVIAATGRRFFSGKPFVVTQATEFAGISSQVAGGRTTGVFGGVVRTSPIARVTIDGVRRGSVITAEAGGPEITTTPIGGLGARFGELEFSTGGRLSSVSAETVTGRGFTAREFGGSVEFPLETASIVRRIRRSPVEQTDDFGVRVTRRGGTGRGPTRPVELEVTRSPVTGQPSQIVTRPAQIEAPSIAQQISPQVSPVTTRTASTIARQRIRQLQTPASLIGIRESQREIISPRLGFTERQRFAEIQQQAVRITPAQRIRQRQLTESTISPTPVIPIGIRPGFRPPIPIQRGLPRIGRPGLRFGGRGGGTLLSGDQRGVTPSFTAVTFGIESEKEVQVAGSPFQGLGLRPQVRPRRKERKTTKKVSKKPRKK